MRKTSRSR